LKKRERKITVSVYARDNLIANYLKNLLSTDPNILPTFEPRSEPPSAVVVESGLLSEVEQRVLKALIQHGSIAEVAAALHYSPSTVKTYLSRIYKKLKVKTACQAVAFAIRYRLIELD